MNKNSNLKKNSTGRPWGTPKNLKKMKLNKKWIEIWKEKKRKKITHKPVWCRAPPTIKWTHKIKWTHHRFLQRCVQTTDFCNSVNKPQISATVWTNHRFPQHCEQTTDFCNVVNKPQISAKVWFKPWTTRMIRLSSLPVTTLRLSSTPLLPDMGPCGDRKTDPEASPTHRIPNPPERSVHPVPVVGRTARFVCGHHCPHMTRNNAAKVRSTTCNTQHAVRNTRQQEGSSSSASARS